MQKLSKPGRLPTLRCTVHLKVCWISLWCLKTLQTASWKRPLFFSRFLPNPGTTLSQLNKRRSVANAEAQLKLAMKLEAADWLKNHHTNPRSNYISAERTQKTLNIIQTVYSYVMEREKLIQKKKICLSGNMEVKDWPLILIIYNKSKFFFFLNVWTLGCSLKEKYSCFCSETEKMFSISAVREKNWINPRFQTKQPQGSRAAQSIITRPRRKKKKKKKTTLLHTLKRNICHFRGLHPKSH